MRTRTSAYRNHSFDAMGYKQVLRLPAGNRPLNHDANHQDRSSKQQLKKY